ncbi:MAG: hypothetical protein KY442_12450, partial [Proteobacteria bacterium]|nr:hypothetical protein [Pseudomonadota bacterium]
MLPDLLAAAEAGVLFDALHVLTSSFVGAASAAIVKPARADMHPIAAEAAPTGIRSIADYGPDGLALVHQVEGLVDPLQRQ